MRQFSLAVVLGVAAVVAIIAVLATYFGYNYMAFGGLKELDIKKGKKIEIDGKKYAAQKDGKVYIPKDAKKEE